jgi:malate synthase
VASATKFGYVCFVSVDDLSYGLTHQNTFGRLFKTDTQVDQEDANQGAQEITNVLGSSNNSLMQNQDQNQTQNQGNDEDIVIRYDSLSNHNHARKFSSDVYTFSCSIF